MITEFDIIQRYFSPLAGKEGIGLVDDAAHFMPPDGKKLVISKDMLVEGVHFLPDTDPSDLAWKALAVNVSDLVAKGAKPVGYLLGLGLPEAPSAHWLEKFTDGLKAAQESFGCHLFGGDTVKSAKGIILSITVIGSAPLKSPLRKGAKDGDLIYVSGTLGDSAYGLKSIRSEIPHNDYLIERYLKPQPRCDLIDLVSKYATSSADISDGLMADMGHIAKASNVGAELYSSEIPLSSAVKTIADPKCLETICTWGDDYEILFTIAAEEEENMLNMHKSKCMTPIHKIGLVKQNLDVKILNKEAKPIKFKMDGYKHF